MLVKALVILGILVLWYLGHKFLNWVHKRDPLHSSEYYKEEGCAHVDGFLCSYPYCHILENYTSEKKKEIDKDQDWM